MLTLRYRLPIALAALVAVAVVLKLSSQALAQSPEPALSPSPLWTGVDLSKEDVVRFFKALEVELTPNAGTVLVEIVPADKLPAYDPLVHYAGIGADDHPNHPVVMSNQSAKPGDATQDALASAFMLAVMDCGEAGPKWKSIYDAAAAADAALPPSSPDPYLHRHELTQQLRSLEKSSH